MKSRATKQQEKKLAKGFRKEIGLVFSKRHQSGLSWTREFVADRVGRIRKLQG